MGPTIYRLARGVYSVNIKLSYDEAIQMKKLLEVFALLLVSGTYLILGSVNAYAATSSASVNGYRVSPVRTDLTIKPGSNAVVTVLVQNASAAVENIQTIVNDFQAPTDESGNPALLLNGATAPRHSLKQFVKIENGTFSLTPGQQKSVNIDLSVPAGTAGGGYYGAIRFAPAVIGGDRNVNLSASVASLVLVTVPGNLSEQLFIKDFGVTQGKSTVPSHLFFSNKNLSALVSFQNNGNVQEQPFGKVVLKKGSTTLQTIAVNDSDSPGNVLPDSARRFTVTLNKVGWYGKYKAQGNFGYGSQGQLLSAQYTFYVIPIVFIFILVLIILVILFLIFGLPRLIRRYNRRVIARANRNQHHRY